jgi:hypothetical protein
MGINWGARDVAFRIGGVLVITKTCAEFPMSTECCPGLRFVTGRTDKRKTKRSEIWEMPAPAGPRGTKHPLSLSSGEE